MENEEDREKMQTIINNLVEWAKKWAMQFNASKCKILHVGRNNPRYDYFMGDTKIEEDVEEKTWVYGWTHP